MTLKNLVIGLVWAAALAGNAAAADLSAAVNKLEGKWKPVTAELAGQPMLAAVLQSISLKLDAGKYEVFVGAVPDRGTYSLDASGPTPAMTIVGTEGPNQGRTIPAIYELKDDTLRICYNLSGTERPTEFKAPAGTRLYLVTYRRVKE